MDFAVKRIEPIDVTTIRKILTSPQITEAEKIKFVRQNDDAIKQTLSISPNAIEYAKMMKNRPLEKFKPVKNSFTKRGDKILLAKALNIEPTEVENYIEKMTEAVTVTGKLNFLDENKLSAVQTYIFRHGSTDLVTQFLDYDLRKSKDKVKAIYRNLEYHSGGMADYFIRPIHRMSNKTLVELYQVFDKNLTEAQDNGDITQEESMELSKTAIKKLYEIQNNSKFINSIKTYRVLSH